MNVEEKVSSLHKRMENMRCLREKRKTGVIGAFTIGLAACLMILIFGEGAAHLGGTAGIYSGATMLFEGVGGYVLVAVISFAAAVIITVACVRWQRKQNDKANSSIDKNIQSEEKDHEQTL